MDEQQSWGGQGISCWVLWEAGREIKEAHSRRLGRWAHTLFRIACRSAASGDSSP